MKTLTILDMHLLYMSIHTHIGSLGNPMAIQRSVSTFHRNTDNLLQRILEALGNKFNRHYN